MSISVLPRRRPLVTDGSIASIHGLEIGAERSLPIFSMGVSAGFLHRQKIIWKDAWISMST